MEVKKCQVSASGFLPPHSLLSTSVPPLEGKGKEVCRDTFFILFYCSVIFFFFTYISSPELELIFNRLAFKPRF